MPRTRDPDVVISLTLDQLNYILSVLGKRPFEEAADVIVELRNQASAQLQRAQQANEARAERSRSVVDGILSPATQVAPTNGEDRQPAGHDGSF